MSKKLNQNTRAGLIKAASGRIEADLIIKDAQVLNVFTNEIQRGNVAVYNGYIAGIGEYVSAKKIIDAYGQYLVPGFINAHCHVESAMVSPEFYCAEELRGGVTTLITDPHEIANVAGLQGIFFMLEAAASMPINYFVQLPSCVPATEYEHSGAVLTAGDLKTLLKQPRVLGLGEMMNYPGVLNCEPSVLDKLSVAGDRVIDGHAPAVTGYALSGYAAAGISTDHESISFAEAKEKLRAGLAVLVREGSSCRNLEDLITGVVNNKIKTEFMAFCTDDKHLADIRREGTIRYCVQRAIALGRTPAEAYCMATINAARIYRLRGLGAIAPGYRADMVLLSDLLNVTVSRVFKDGLDIEEPGLPKRRMRHTLTNSVNLPPLTMSSFALPAPTKEGLPVIGVVAGQLITRKSYVAEQDAQNALKDGALCKVAVIERHHATGNIGVGLLKGYGLKDGAVASTVGHDSHNLIIAGTNDEDMLRAAEEVGRIRGGFALIRGGQPVASLPLPVYGLMSDKSPQEFLPRLENMLRLLHAAGVGKDIDPLITLSFLALPVIPEIRITDKGVFDVTQLRFL